MKIIFTSMKCINLKLCRKHAAKYEIIEKPLYHQRSNLIDDFTPMPVIYFIKMKMSLFDDSIWGHAKMHCCVRNHQNCRCITIAVKWFHYAQSWKPRAWLFQCFELRVALPERHDQYHQHGDNLYDGEAFIYNVIEINFVGDTILIPDAEILMKAVDISFCFRWYHCQLRRFKYKYISCYQ